MLNNIKLPKWFRWLIVAALASVTLGNSITCFRALVLLMPGALQSPGNRTRQEYLDRTELDLEQYKLALGRCEAR